MARRKLDHLTDEERRDHEREAGATRQAAFRARNRRLGLPDGRALDAAVASAMTHNVVEGLMRDCPSVNSGAGTLPGGGYVALEFIQRCALGYLLGCGYERHGSKALLHAHLHRRDTAPIRLALARQRRGDKDLWVETQEAKARRRKPVQATLPVPLDGVAAPVSAPSNLAYALGFLTAA